MFMKRVLLAIVVLAAGMAAASAQSFPSRPVTLLVPFAPGGITDIIGRVVGERMRVSLGQPVIIENVSGASGGLAVNRLHRSAPDGYTIIIGQWTSHVGGAATNNFGFSILDDFQPLSLLSIGPLWIIGGGHLPVKDMKELIVWLKANPKRGAAGTSGLGGGTHMCLLDFQHKTGTQFPLIPYRGVAPVMQDMLAGQIDLSCPEAGQTLPQFRAGSIKAFAVLSPKRWFAAPDVPTIDEAGVPGLHFPFWHALWAPKGTPQDVVAKLNAAISDALADPVVKQKLIDLGHEIAAPEQQTPAGLYAVHKADVDRWWPIIKAADIKPQ
jgi:tripartite-type tricarboxylate transporter receptor subunit TctC